MGYTIPESLRKEHEELHAELAQIIKSGGEAGTAAGNVARVLHPHFLKEEEFALPPLGLLVSLAAGKVTPDMAGAAKMAGKLKAEMPEMLAEHREIVGALKPLEEAAKKENKPQAARFAEKLALHARTEEEVLYPASILAGEFIGLKLKT